jgi:hypothetical protein
VNNDEGTILVPPGSNTTTDIEQALISLNGCKSSPSFGADRIRLTSSSKLYNPKLYIRQALRVIPG